MLTLRFHRAPLGLAATIGLLMGIGGCAAEASSSSTPPASQLAPRDPLSMARMPKTISQDPPPPRPSTQEGCDACAGLWAAHGIEPIETCICKTNDEGRDCTDGNDCQGECLLEGDAEFHVVEQSDPPRGYFKGHCASYDTTFGCFRHIPDDVQSQLPLPPEEVGQVVCVD